MLGVGGCPKVELNGLEFAVHDGNILFELIVLIFQMVCLLNHVVKEIDSIAVVVNLGQLLV